MIVVVVVVVVVLAGSQKAHMKLLKFHPLRHLRYVLYTEFHEDSEFRHESSRNLDPELIFEENLNFRNM